jgi:hypothetical protein
MVVGRRDRRQRGQALSGGGNHTLFVNCSICGTISWEDGMTYIGSKTGNLMCPHGIIANGLMWIRRLYEMVE